MSTVSLPITVIARARELFVLYSKKSAFQIDEYSDVGAVFKRLTEAATSEETADVTEVDVKYIISAINVCSQRTPIEIQNYKPIADLLEILSNAIKSDLDVNDEETKTDL